MMNEGFTAEDFARVNLATRGEFEVARRVDPDDALAWRACHDDGREVFLTDDCMSRAGWTPVVESRVTENALPDAQGNAARKRQKLVDHIADQDRVIRRRNDEIAVLRRERDRLAQALRRSYGWREGDGTLTLDGLEAVWEAAEQVDECREGDVLIIRDDEDNYLVRRMDDRSRLDSTARILSRAPRREPWEDLADDLAEVLDADARYSEELARDLHNGGWRKGGDDGE